MNRFVFILLLTTTLIGKTTHAQLKQEIKKGSISMEEMQMKVYAKDTSAPAVTLYQSIEFVPDQFTVYHYYRVKILKSTGKDYGTMFFMGKLKQAIKGTSYNLENGKIVKTKLSRESIFEERIIGDFYRTGIAMPNVKEGTVFEVSIEQNGLPSSIEIQQNIPVIYTYIYFPGHPVLDFRINEFGYLGPTFKENVTWIYKDLPAFVKEPYITSDKDLRVRMEFEITSLSLNTYYWWLVGHFASSWGAVTNMFNDNIYQGKKITSYTSELRDIADSMKKCSLNEEELVKKAFEAIKVIKWNNETTCYTSPEFERALKYKKGNSADINIMLINLLKQLGLKSYPVLFSTRDHGKINRNVPTLAKLNYLIAAVDLNSGTKYLDATNEFAPYNLEPERVLGCYGHPIGYYKPDCSVYIESVKKDKKSSFSQFKIDSTGSIKGTVSTKRFDYNAIAFKKQIKAKEDNDSYIKELEANNSGVTIDSFKFLNFDNPYQDFVDEYQINISKPINTQDILLVNPFVIIKQNENPFQNEKRNLPISFPQQIEYSSRIIISFPNNYQVTDLPKGVDITNRDNSAKFTYQIQQLGNTISISSKFVVNKLRYENVEYAGLKALWDLVLQKQNESIIFKQI